MDEATRLHYLAAMGIDVWVSRHPAIAAPEAASESYILESRVEQSDAYQVNLAPSDHLAIPDQTGRRASLHSVQPSDASQTDDQYWKVLQQEVSNCHACTLSETRTQTVFGVGNRQASWMLIGEAPGQNEDLQGEPFVGRAGQLLNEMLRAIGLQRDEVFIANILKCRPPNNRDPQTHEVTACESFLQRQIALLKPRIILAVGRVAAQNLLRTQQPLSRLRGKSHVFNDTPLVVVHHPAYLLRSPTEKARAWEDLQFAWSVCQSIQQ